MTKTKFCQIMKEIEDGYRLDLAFYNLCNKYSREHKTDLSIEGIGTLLVSTTIDLLAEIMGDKDDWISYYCWELDFGNDWTEGSIKMNGEPVDISSREKLYDFLRNEYGK